MLVIGILHVGLMIDQIENIDHETDRIMWFALADRHAILVNQVRFRQIEHFNVVGKGFDTNIE